MRVGQLDSRVEIQSAVGHKDRTGQVIVSEEDFVTSHTVWGNVSTLAGRELVNAKAVMSLATVKITIRYLPELRVTHRFKVGSRIFHIQSIVNSDTWSECLCSEKVT